MPSDKKLWVTRTQSAGLIGLSSRQFDEVIRTRLPKSAKRGAGKTLRYDAAEIVAAFVSYRFEQEAARFPTDEDDPLLNGAGGNTPNLERYRGYRADLAKRDVEERDKVLVRRNVILDALRPALSGMRCAGEKLIRQFGNDAGDIYNEAVDNFVESVNRLATNIVPVN